MADLDRAAPLFLAGHRGLVGSAILRACQASGWSRILVRDRQGLDLCDQAAVSAFFERERPAYVILAAARVGGILANHTRPADFILENLQIQDNVIAAAHRTGCRKFVFLGSSCIYPKHAPQPMREDSLLTGELEPTNAPYAVAKIAGIVLCQSLHRQYGFPALCLMPTNLYGPGDNFDLESSHVLPAMIRKFHDARTASAPTVGLWGTGSPRREFLHVDDLAQAVLFLMERSDDPAIVNVGVGEDVTIRDLAALIQEVTGFTGTIRWDSTKPDGTPRKLLDVSRLHALGWKARIGLKEGIQATYAWFTANGAGTLTRPSRT